MVDPAQHRYRNAHLQVKNTRQETKGNQTQELG